MSLLKGFKRLEYIQSSGTQYINTLFKPNQNTRVFMDAYMTKEALPSFFFGCRNSSYNVNFGLLVNASGVRSTYNASTITLSGADAYIRSKIDANKNVCLVDGVSITHSEGTFQTEFDLFLLCSNEFGTAKYFGNIRLYVCQIYDNGTLVRDFIPCQNADGDIGLWDDVNAAFYGNAGTGTFTAGPEVVIALDPPASVEQVLSVKLAWSAVDNASFYRIYRDGVQIGETEDLTYADDTAEFGQTYLYGITACSGSSESEPTELTVYTREGYAVIRPVVTSANFP